MSNKINYNFGSITKLGEQQSFNTDSIIDFPIFEGHVFLVCDGHNGNEGHGALAAKITSESIKKYFHNKSYKDTISALTNAVSFANYSVYTQSKKEDKYNNIGSTLAILIYKKGKIYYAYAGDSRIYLYQQEQLKALTLDHVDDSQNPTQSKVNILIGKKTDIKFGVSKNPLNANANDRFLICTDGVSDVLNNNQIAEVISDNNTSPDHKALLLAQKVENKNGKDNLSAYVIEFSDKAMEKPKKTNKKLTNILIASFLSVILLAIVFLSIKYLRNNKNPNTALQEQQIIPNKENKIEIDNNNNVKTETNNKIRKSDIEKKNVATNKENNKKALQQTNKQEPTFYKHKIKYGENLYRLSLRYAVSQQKLIDINGELARKFIAGKNINVPVKAVHIVKKGESYSTISNTYNVRINAICRTNKSDRNIPLKEGSKIVIPLK